MPRQSDLRFTFEPESSAAPFDVIEFKLEEGLSTPFKLTLELSSHDANVDFADLLDNPAVFTLWRHQLPVRYVQGLVSSITVGQSGFRRTRYRVVLEPQLARLDLCSNWRIFQQLTVPQIIDKVLGLHHLFDREQIITAAHQPREYCVQAGETDLHFIARLAAEEGLLYTFKHSAKGHRLIHTDRVLGLGQIGPDHDCAVIYAGSAGGDQALPAITRFDYTEQVRTARQVQRDYTFTHPRYNQQHEAVGRDLQRQSGTYERYDFPGRYKRDAAGKPFTQTRLLALRNDARIAVAIGDNVRLQPGLGFDLHEHSREAFNTHWRTISIARTSTITTAQGNPVRFHLGMLRQLEELSLALNDSRLAQVLGPIESLIWRSQASPDQWLTLHNSFPGLDAQGAELQLDAYEEAALNHANSTWFMQYATQRLEREQPELVRQFDAAQLIRRLNIFKQEADVMNIARERDLYRYFLLRLRYPEHRFVEEPQLLALLSKKALDARMRLSESEYHLDQQPCAF